MNAAEQYIKDVTEGRITVCKYVRLAIQRHLNDLKRDDLVFDHAAGERPLKFFPELKHFKGQQFAGKPFELSGWQAFIIYSLFGWKYKESGKRRFTQSYTEISKKNGKTTLAAGIGLYMLKFDQEPGAEVYSAATSRDQAREVFDAAKAMVLKNPELQKHIQVQARSLFDTTTMSKFEPLSSDYDSFEGKNPYCAIIDEYHAHSDSLLFDNISAASVARDRSLIWIITTAGFNKESPCYHFRKMCIDVLEGRIQDDGLFSIIFTLDEKDDWNNPEVWIKSNPNLGVSVFPDKIQDLYQKAKNSTTSEVGFKTKNLNIWTDSSSVWIPDDRWQQCNQISQDELLEKVKGQQCWGAIDLSTTKDISVFALLFKLDKFYFLPFFFLPGMTMIERVRRDHVNYDKWIREGWVIETDGDVVDYDVMRAKINELAKKYKIKSIQYDRWNSSQLVTNLMSDGANMQPFGQGYQSMSNPTKELEKYILKKEFEFGGNPVMRWMNSNIEIRKDEAGNYKIDKKKSSEKVDGMVTLVMSLGGFMTDRGPVSIYDTRGILTI